MRGERESELLSEIRERLGGIPPLFQTLAEQSPRVLEVFWRQAQCAYLDSPLPRLLVERIAARLARHCLVSYCLNFQCERLKALGMAADDIISFILDPRSPDPGLLWSDQSEVQRVFAEADWPTPDSAAERYLLTLIELYFLKGEDALLAQSCLLKCLGRARFDELLLLISFLRSSHHWIESHPELSAEDRETLESERPLEAAQLSEIHCRQPVARADPFLVSAFQELRDPLRMVYAFLQLLESRCGSSGDQDVRDYVEFALQGARRLRSVIGAITDYGTFARLEEPPREVDVARLVDGVRESLSAEIERAGAEIRCGSLPCIVAGPRGLQEVFDQLFRNAMAYGDRRPVVGVSAVEETDRWVIGVSDNGHGIAPEKLKTIFLPFQRGRGNFTHCGLGIGLAMVKLIVERQGGSVWVESKPGVGSTFYFALPKDRLPVVSH